MKLSFKFFFMAYLLVLLSVGAGGTFLIGGTADTVWNAQADRVTAAEHTAAESFLSYTDMLSDKVNIASAAAQIKPSLDSCVSDLTVIPAALADEPYTALADNEGLTRYIRREGKLYMESACRVKTGSDRYIVAVTSDFSAVQDTCDRIRRIYGIAVVVIAAVSGALLFLFSRQITRPLKRLTVAANDIAGGNYGKTVDTDAAGGEIADLTRSFNHMSVAVDDSLRDIRREAEKREAFVANFSHEMKTPMTAILGYTEMLRSYDLRPEETAEAIDAIHSEAGRLEDLSRRLLELFVTRHEAFTPAPCALDVIAARLPAALRFSAEKSGVTLTVDLPAVTVAGNEPLLLSLIYNLCDNAFKASPAGETVSVTGQAEGETVSVTVTDHGRGIPPEHLRRVTEPFYRADTARSRAEGGAGLGLALCREIAALHGGELTFDSTPGEGTTVSFALRLWRDDDEA